MRPEEPEQPPKPVVHDQELAAIVATSAVIAKPSVERGLNDLRLAVLGILVTIGLSFGFGVSAWWPIRVAAGLGAFGAACLLIYLRPSRRLLMSFMDRLTRV